MEDPNKNTEFSNNTDSSELVSKDFLNFLSVAHKLAVSSEKNMSNEEFNKLVSNYLAAFDKAENQDRSSISVFRKFEGQGIDSTLMCHSGETQCHNKKRVGEAISSLERKYNILMNKKSTATSVSNLSEKLRTNLSDLLQEEILDSVLPYISPKIANSDLNKINLSDPNATKRMSFSCFNFISNNRNCSELPHSRHSVSLRGSSNPREATPKSPELSIELEINVHDERKQMRSTFKCSKELLVFNMGYFKDVSVGQYLEDMDISVHCDIQVFDWLMKWVKRNEHSPSTWPALETEKVVPILVSAFFLRMDGLIDECLKFFKQNANEILASDPNIGCVNDKILEKISEMFSNEEIENLIDEKDKLQSKLFIRLIIQLWKNDKDEKKGHYSTIKYLRKCVYCKKIFDLLGGHLVPCSYGNLRLDVRGRVHGIHRADPKWNLNSFIRKLRHSEVRTWRRIYWKLWGLCHYLYCRNCSTYYAVYYGKCCEYHPHASIFGPINGSYKNIEGHFPCCGQRIFRYEALPNYFGCQLKNHVPKMMKYVLPEVLTIFTKHEALITGDSSELTSRVKSPLSSLYAPGTRINDIFDLSSKPNDNVICWFGMNIFPSTNCCILGLPRAGNKDSKMNAGQQKSLKKAEIEKFTIKYHEFKDSKIRQGFSNSSSLDRSQLSDETVEEDCEYDLLPKRVDKMFSNYFSPSRRRRKSLRNFLKNHPTEPVNTQDDFMREHESELMLTLVSRLTKKTTSKDLFSELWPKYSHIVGGAYCQLEAEWKDENFKSVTSPTSGSSSNLS